MSDLIVFPVIIFGHSCTDKSLDRQRTTDIYNSILFRNENYGFETSFSGGFAIVTSFSTLTRKNRTPRSLAGQPTRLDTAEETAEER